MDLLLLKSDPHKNLQSRKSTYRHTQGPLNVEATVKRLEAWESQSVPPVSLGLPLSPRPINRMIPPYSICSSSHCRWVSLLTLIHHGYTKMVATIPEDLGSSRWLPVAQ
jgi:hypothetical protein